MRVVGLILGRDVRKSKAAVTVTFPYIYIYIYIFHIYFLAMFHIFSLVCFLIYGVKSGSGHDGSQSFGPIWHVSGAKLGF